MTLWVFVGQSKRRWLTSFQWCAGALRGEIGSGNCVRYVAFFSTRLATGLSNLTACSSLSVLTLMFKLKLLSKIALNFSVLFLFFCNRPCICSHCFCAGLSASSVQPPTVKVSCQIWCTCICLLLLKVINSMQNEGYLLYPKRNHCSQM